MRCTDCPRHDSETGSCLDGKLNPVTLTEAVEVAQHIGPRSICMMNDHREQILDIWRGAKLSGKPTRRPHRPVRAWYFEY